MNFPRLTNINSLQLFQLMRFGGFFLTGILLIKSGLNVNIVGNFEKLMFLAGLSSFFWVQGILNTFLSRYNQQSNKKEYLFNVFLLISLISLIVFTLLKIFDASIISMLSDGDLPGYSYISLYVLFNAPSYLIETIYIIHKKSGALVRYGIINSIITVMVIVVPVYKGYSIESGIALLALWSALRYLWLVRLLLKYAVIVINSSYLKDHLSVSAPLILSFIIAGSAEYIDGFLVNHFFEPARFAIFRYGARELPLSLLMANALSTAVIPTLLANGEWSFAELKKETTRLIHIVFPVSLLLILLSPWLFTTFFSQQFRESASVFNIYLLLVISRTLFPQTIMMAGNFNKIMLRIAVIEILINIVCSFFLMKLWGLPGIAVGTFIAAFSEKLILMMYLKKYHGIAPSGYIPSIWWKYSVALAGVYVFMLIFTS